ncbi:6,7-dimethyl-8-ribityllumazine synthase [Candidatus Geothermarchaeota archaeon ex4572_27]|nr:MAG: 6,7-dimethyl-8-ribityllumazine synthase [Candidatus Geothermarchaeota archaeon ex4572_27]
MGSEPIRLGLVVSEFNYDITYLMLQKAISHAKFLGAEVRVVVKSPGCYDVAILVDELLKRDDVDAAVVLGAVIQGETKHDEVVAHQAARKLIDLSIQHGKPVALGVIGPGATRAQALERAEEYARRGVEAAVKLARRLKELRSKARVEGTWVVE